MEYKMLRLMSFFGAAVLPLVFTIIIGVAGFLILGNDLIGVGLFTVFGAMFSVILCGFAGFAITGQNVWVKAIQAEAMLLFSYSSTGNGQIFSCVTRQNPSGGMDVVTNISGQDVVLAYDKPMSYRVLAPARAFMDLFKRKKLDDGSIEKSKTIITIENEDFDKYAMRFGYLTILFFNNETGTLTNKFAINELEKFYAMKYLSLHLDRKMDIYIAELRMARKNFFDALLNKLQAFMKGPMFPILIIIVVGIVGLVLISVFWPQISGFFGGIVPHAPGAAIDSNVVAPITHGTSGTVGGPISSLPKTS